MYRYKVVPSLYTCSKIWHGCHRLMDLRDKWVDEQVCNFPVTNVETDGYLLLIWGKGQCTCHFECPGKTILWICMMYFNKFVFCLPNRCLRFLWREPQGSTQMHRGYRPKGIGINCWSCLEGLLPRYTILSKVKHSVFQIVMYKLKLVHPLMKELLALEWSRFAYYLSVIVSPAKHSST